MQKGFTLVEMLLVLAVTLILISLSVVSLSTIRDSTSKTTTLQVLLSDIKLQQTKSMDGDTSGNTTAQSFGVYFSSNSYTVFSGTTYSASDSTNFTVQLPADLQFSSITFPSSQIVFAKGSGEVSNFVSGSNTVTLRNQITNQTSVITINKYGVFTSVNNL